ncbi:MAG: type IV secretion system DNA-binding domain-containing protein [Candidatus Micrarchaeota archaeon]|nr:type IV secretion system DNA-binding domain-containing protein [Candidatus Micrarchaeota archaeon]
MPQKTAARELLLYSERIKAEDVLNLFNQVLKARMPLFGLIDFSDLFSLDVLELVVKRRLNTVQFFVHDKKSLGTLSMLVFPYKISEPIEIEKKAGSFLPYPKIYFLVGDRDFLSFMLKESIEEMNLKIIKIFGKFLGFGTAVDEKGKKSVLVSTSPERLLVLDLEKNPSIYVEVLDPIPKRVSLSSKYPVFEETGITVGVDNFDVFQHTLFVGASGTGKSRSIYAMIKAIEAMHGDGVRIVLLDPHGEFIRSMHYAKTVNFIENYIEPLDVGGMKTPLMTQLIAQLLSSAIGQENKYSERVLFYTTHLLSSLGKMDLKNIGLLLTDSAKRAEFLSETDNDEVKRFFDEEFNDIYTRHFNDAILPILNFVGEYELYLGGKKKQESLLELIDNNRLIVISFNPNFFGKRMISFMAGAIINQMYILAITEKLKLPTILVIDEFQRVETKVVKDILAEKRKFNLYVYLSMQSLGQVSKEVHDSLVSNIRNIVAFKANRQDAAMLSSMMEIKIEEAFKKSRTQAELEESKKEMFIRLHQRECIVRLFDGKNYILPMKLRVVDVYKLWGYKEMPLEQLSPLSSVPPSMVKKQQPQESHLEQKQEEPGFQMPLHEEERHEPESESAASSAPESMQPPKQPKQEAGESSQDLAADERIEQEKEPSFFDKAMQPDEEKPAKAASRVKLKLAAARKKKPAAKAKPKKASKKK